MEQRKTKKANRYKLSEGKKGGEGQKGRKNDAQTPNLFPSDKASLQSLFLFPISAWNFRLSFFYFFLFAT
jgi:hypothetical protein